MPTASNFTLLPYFIVGNIIVSALVGYALWLFRSGKWVGKHEADEEAFRQAMERRVRALQAALDVEHKNRRELTEVVHLALGKHETMLARHDERLKSLERP